MSTNSECLFVEVEPGRWYYILEDRDAPKDAFSWLDYATAYGPFADMQQTAYHLHENHANPGGHSVMRYGSGVSPSVTKLIAECDTKRMTPTQRVTVANGHRSARPSGNPRLMPQTKRRARSMTNTTKRYIVVMVETVTREAVMDIDILSSQDHADAEAIALERLACGYDIPWEKPKKTVRATGARKS